MTVHSDTAIATYVKNRRLVSCEGLIKVNLLRTNVVDVVEAFRKGKAIANRISISIFLVLKLVNVTYLPRST